VPELSSDAAEKRGGRGKSGAGNQLRKDHGRISIDNESLLEVRQSTTVSQNKTGADALLLQAM
jgi:hypothetical protein